MFHELLEVDAFVTVYVCSEAQRDNLLFLEVNLSILQALDVFVDLKESILVTIVPLEYVKKLKCFKLNVLNIKRWLELFRFKQSSLLSNASHTE